MLVRVVRLLLCPLILKINQPRVTKFWFGPMRILVAHIALIFVSVSGGN